jgi:hypothetical protein
MSHYTAVKIGMFAAIASAQHPANVIITQRVDDIPIPIPSASGQAW